MSTSHAHNISTNLFYAGSAPPRAELQPLNGATAIFPQTWNRKVDFWISLKTHWVWPDSRQFQVEFFLTARTASSQRYDRLNRRVFSPVILETNPQLSLQFSIKVPFPSNMSRLLQVKLSVLSPCPRKEFKLKILPVVTSCWMPLTEIRAFFIGLPNLSDTIPFIPRWTWQGKAKLDGSHVLQYHLLIFYRETPVERKQLSRGSTCHRGF